MKLAFRFLTIIFAIALAALFLRLQVKTYSQASDCPQTKTPRWAPGTTVYYNFGNITDNGMKNQIRDGASKWTKANQSDGSGVKFVEGPPPQGATGYSTVTFQTGTVSGGIAHTSYSCSGCTNMTSATITFDTSQTNVYDPSAAGWDTMILKQSLHELGHTMGLTDAPNPTGNGCNQIYRAKVKDIYDVQMGRWAWDVFLMRSH